MSIVADSLSGNAERIITRPYDGMAYAGLSYEDASRVGLALVRAAAETGQWAHLPEHLTALRRSMRLDGQRLGGRSGRASFWSNLKHQLFWEDLRDFLCLRDPTPPPGYGQQEVVYGDWRDAGRPRYSPGL